MLRTTIGQLLVNRALPPRYRDYGRVVDKKEVQRVLDRLAKEDPDQYPDVIKKLHDVGRIATSETGGYSFSLEDLETPEVMVRARAEIEAKLDALDQRDDLTPDQRAAETIKIVAPYQATLAKDIHQELIAKRNPLALQALSGARGNENQLKTLVGGDLLYTDNEGREIPVPVLNSYADGLTPVEYFAGAFGTRQGATATKLSVASGGFFGKQLAQLNHRMVVSAEDSDEPYDESNPRGLPTPIDDVDNEGAFLAHPTAGYPRNTELTPKVLKDMRDAGVEEVLVRSPIVGGPADGSVYAYDLGRRERGQLTPVGTFVGLAAGAALSEPVTQMALSSKHSGGVSKGAKRGRGFAEINELVQAQRGAIGAATHATTDGQITDIVDAPQGGKYVSIGEAKHYVPADIPLLVSVGDEIEAGDRLSDGIPSPADVVEHKGIGEGARAFVEQFRDALRRNGVSAHRRNLELIGRGLVNYVQLDDELGDYGPDDVVPYYRLESLWEPRPGHVVRSPQSARNQYLERPVLHYTVGTKLRPSVIATLQRHGVQKVTTHAAPPPFRPKMVRAMEHISYDPDPMTRMLGSYQQRSLTQAAQTGAVSDEASPSYVPSLIRGVDFAKVGPIAEAKLPPATTPTPPKLDLGPTPPPRTGLFSSFFGRA